jgi:hypothetical protein
VIIQGNIVTGNTCMRAPGIFNGMAAGMFVSAKAVIRDNIISVNEASKGPGGIFLHNCEADVFNNYILSNKSGNTGGGIWVFARNFLVRIHDNLFFDNWSAYGGAFCADMCSPVIERNIFYKNKGCRSGGIFCKNRGADPVIRGNLIWHGWACFGGGILCFNGASPLIVGNVIMENSTYSEYCLLSPIQILDTLNGGGIYCWNGCRPTIACNIIARNTALRKGGGIGCWDSSPLLFGNTICGNKAMGDVGGIFCNEKSNPKIYNTIIWDNEPGEITGEAELTCCDVKGGWPGESNLDLDPGFLAGGNEDFRLSSLSPLKDAGFCLFDGMPDTDFEGDPRSAGGGVDIGADECFPWTKFVGPARPGDALRVETGSAPASGPASIGMAGLQQRPGWSLPLDRLEALPEGMTGDPTKGLPLPVPSVPIKADPLEPWSLITAKAKGGGFSIVLPPDAALIGAALEWVALGQDRHGEWKPSGRTTRAKIRP